MTLAFTRENSYGVESTYQIPARYDVCDRCHGHGTHLHPAIGEHAYTPDEFRETFDDEEAEDYSKRGGRYDVPCETCGGARVVLVPDWGACQETLRGRRLMALFTDNQEREAEWRRQDAAERRMGY